MWRSAPLVVLAMVLMACLALPLTPPPAAAQGPSRAGLVVVYSAGNVVTTCVSFSEAQLTGSELLRRAGLRVVSASTTGVGDSICKINAVGCDFPGEQCFCQCLGSPCLYWNYWYMQNGKWTYSGRGAGNRTVRNGDVDAWVWGDGSTPPPAVDQAALCGMAPAVAATPTSLSTLPTRAPASATPAPPSATALASATAAPVPATTVASQASALSVAGTTTPTSTIAPTSTALPTATALPSAPPSPSASAPSPIPSPALPTAWPPTPTPALPRPGAAGGYIAFGVLAAGLLAAALYATLRAKA